ncbi:hypothetical protein CNBN0450 [Cryptococcus deneoformans B-3501A]|uniref:hypothetical protein n=1 Tax=Cryptococcus deneoformans (strain B-3501A) TaxID=283643 RepID=UPI000042D625|nr:hypothetical protein CNBN0450 [Cryptococcus neoformans var. neoformans B-3501A]EAL17217.1 hypothetical protein CNBN0450 [Cryptococcus neoformans var. neoformans B-3501A]
MADKRPPIQHSATTSYGFSNSHPSPRISSSSGTTFCLNNHFHNPSHPPEPEAQPTPLTTTQSPLSFRRGRGMTFEEARKEGIISQHERSGDFDGLPISDDEISTLPKKLRPYYRNLARLREHYLEVDGILSGELTHNIALSFTPSRTYMQRLGDLEEEVASPKAARRDSYWRTNGARGGDGYGDENGDPGEETPLLADAKAERREKLARLALSINTIVNILLVGGKTAAVLHSSSISLAASLVDSALDLLSTFIILGTSLAIGMKTDSHKYPTGKRRFEPLGVLIFSVAMIASFVQVFIESFKRTIGPPEEDPINLGPLGVGIMLVTIGIKAILWAWCSRIPSSGVQALAQDAENDVFFNAMSLAFPWIGSLLHWRLLDPIGGMILSSYIIVEWIKTLHENFANLSGKTASADQITRVLYLVSRFNPVLEIADIECYHIGDDLIVEVDVILPKSSSLHYAHDVGETIQCVIESLDGVIRAYVHCDYSSSNPLQHTSRTPQPYPINRFQSSGGSSSGSGSGTPTPRPIHYLNSNTMGLDGINEITAPTSTNPKSSGEGGIGHEGDRPSFQGEGR